jgi:alkanesulfonate monooxygenase SsuD/methylene tetrahydromethanopterin reductase-like flavin-dependent oxidoreductase (luciferase family)
MKYGFVLPFGDARTAANAARAAEQAGWDGFFVWEPIWGNDAWVCLTAAAMVTEKIKLGTMITPLSRMRPWKLASESATLDNLANGRVILAVGLGAPETGFAEFGEETNRKTRAELLDEGLDIVTGLWRGQPFNYNGTHYHIRETQFQVPPPPVQKPRIPIWVVGAWKRKKSMQRVLKYDGLIPNVMQEGKHVPATPEDIRAMKQYVAEHRAATTPFDIVWEGTTPGDDRAKAKSMVQPWVDAGATWWNEAAWNEKNIDNVLRRIHQGPPKID